MPDRIKRLGTLLRLYRSREEQRGRSLRDAVTRLSHEQRQLDYVETLRDEYQQDLERALETGLSASRLKNHRRFSAGLDSVHTEQASRVETAAQLKAEQRASWLAARQQVKGFEKLEERVGEKLKAEDSRNERKQMDEVGHRAETKSLTMLSRERSKGSGASR